MGKESIGPCRARHGGKPVIHEQSGLGELGQHRVFAGIKAFHGGCSPVLRKACHQAPSDLPLHIVVLVRWVDGQGVRGATLEAEAGRGWLDAVEATQAKQVFYLYDPTRNNWRVVEDVHHRKLWDHPSIGVNEIDVVNDTRSNDFPLAVNLGDDDDDEYFVDGDDMYFLDNDDDGESSVAPTINNDSFFNDDNHGGDTYSLDNDDDDEFINDVVVHVYCSSDDSD